MESILGQAPAIELLRRMLARRRIPHSLLFQGPEGVGKATLARALATELLCERQEQNACGACRSCRMTARASHPDLLEIGFIPMKDRPNELRKVIVVEQIRELTHLAGLAPREGRYRIFIIDPADRMNLESQNSLLKTLEEPPGRAVLMLVASRQHLLLPTVRSRCIAVGLSTLRTEELTRLLQQRGMAPEEAAARAALASGRVGKALALDLEELRERRDELVRMLETLAAGREALAKLPDMATAFSGKDEATLLESLDLFQGLLRDAVRTGAGGDRSTLVHADLAKRVAELGDRLGPARAAALVQGADRVRGYLRFNTNRTLIAEGLLAAVAGGPLP